MSSAWIIAAAGAACTSGVDGEPQIDETRLVVVPAPRSCKPVECASLDPIDGDAPIGLSQLLREMVDLGVLTQLPRDRYVARLSSSHDPSSDDAGHGTEEWFANRDVLELEEGADSVLLDAEGPGSLTRIWSADPRGRLRIYLDGDGEPAVDADFADLLAGRVEPFAPPFASEIQGHALYFPIPFASRCRVTLGEASGPVYYQISYRQYEDGTEIETFDADSTIEMSDTLAIVADHLQSARPAAAECESEVLSFELSTDSADSAAVFRASDGGGEIAMMTLTPSVLTTKALRETILVIAFDGQETVRVPLGDFFALGPGTEEVDAIPVTASEDGPLVARWPMPFAREASVSLIAASGERMEAALKVVVVNRPFDDETLLFHAYWHSPETLPSAPPTDWNVVTIEGSGYYVGNVLNIVNSNGSWWGEGDEKIYVDGEDFPSHFGTGTEDYYGYAWCSNETFSEAYVGQPYTSMLKNFGRSTMYRFHVLDAIPFRSSLEFDLEIQHWGSAVDVTYDVTSFWYARQGSAAINDTPGHEDFRVPALPAAPPELSVGLYECD